MPGETIVHIKNVVCKRCIISVQNILDQLGIPFYEIKLGKAHLKSPLNNMQKLKLGKEFSKVGFKLIERREHKIINEIKSAILDDIYSDEFSSKKLSEIIIEKIPYEYGHITHLFTQHEGYTIQSFYNRIKIERVKELLEYDELSITNISDRLGYSTPAYLSSSFKKATGYSPSVYKNLKVKCRQSLDIF
ncbi:helix-turn-helix transcriptional regulator [Gramella sp. AN32]|uniref:Helix-turn-helix transcriptional regulator n=1 Tax=Christiangramia antarctica TaxID=2058158 RepID=A0ABW5X627_9FLAO|nr:helix-turn-helix transcriptional regulator [Gramella sp. AN32]MCM4156619.1 AraC family transcriptional regulator [Gramella sp. AN32]